MKKFIFKLSIWLFPFLVILTTICILNYYFQKPKVFHRVSEISKYNNFIFGDSEIGQLNRHNFYNACLGGENYEYILRKVKLIRQFRKHNYDTIFLGISPRLLFSVQNNNTANENNRKISLTNLYFDEKISTVGIHSLIFNSALPFGDGRGATVEQNGILDSKLITKNCHFSDSDKFYVIDRNFFSLVKFCSENCRHLLIIRPPLSQVHLRTTPKQITKKYKYVINALLLGKPYLDFSGEYWHDKYFFDQNHLNYDGANYFNNQITNRISVNHR